MKNNTKSLWNAVKSGVGMSLISLLPQVVVLANENIQEYLSTQDKILNAESPQEKEIIARGIEGAYDIFDFGDKAHYLGKHFAASQYLKNNQ